MPGRLVRQLGGDRADLAGAHPGGLRSCLTGALLACSRAGRLDDAADILEVAGRLHVRISAGALQVNAPPVVLLSCVTQPQLLSEMPHRQQCCCFHCCFRRNSRSHLLQQVLCLSVAAVSSTDLFSLQVWPICSNASQAILPFVTERLRPDILQQAMETIARQVTTAVRSPPAKRMRAAHLLERPLGKPA